MLNDKFYGNYFFIEIDLNCFEHAKGVKSLVFKVISLRQKSVESIDFFSLKNVKLGKELLLVTHFYFLFLKQLKSILKKKLLWAYIYSLKLVWP